MVKCCSLAHHLFRFLIFPTIGFIDFIIILNMPINFFPDSIYTYRCAVFLFLYQHLFYLDMHILMLYIITCVTYVHQYINFGRTSQLVGVVCASLADQLVGDWLQWHAAGVANGTKATDVLVGLSLQTLLALLAGQTLPNLLQAKAVKTFVPVYVCTCVHVSIH